MVGLSDAALGVCVATWQQLPTHVSSRVAAPAARSSALVGGQHYGLLLRGAEAATIWASSEVAHSWVGVPQIL